MLWRDLDRAPHPGQKVGRRLSTVTVKACSRRSTLTTFMPAAGDHVIDVFIAPCCRIPSQGASPPASSGASHQASLAPRVNQTPRKRDFRSCSICEVFNNIRQFETSLKRLKCANCGHSQTVRGTGQVDPLLPFPFGSGYERNAPKRPFLARQVDLRRSVPVQNHRRIGASIFMLPSAGRRSRNERHPKARGHPSRNRSAFARPLELR